jgi:ABC-type dipeptide/oligopeptide/nickel transport system permease component
MARFALTRSASLVGILLGLSVVVFLLQAVVPADPVRAMVGASGTPQIVEAKRHELGAFLPATVELAATALALAVVLGGALGLLTARGGGTTVRVALVAGASVPAFLLVLLLLIVFYARLRWVPGSGRISSIWARQPAPPGCSSSTGWSTAGSTSCAMRWPIWRYRPCVWRWGLRSPSDGRCGRHCKRCLSPITSERRGRKPSPSAGCCCATACARR